jgi:hypothetical protein
MLVLSRLVKSLGSIPTTTAWYLTDLAEARGRQELFTKQAPQRLRTLREHSIIESAVSSNRIEGVEIEGKRIGTVIFGHRLLKDRDEEEVRGYRNALKLIHAQGSRLKVTEKTIRELHRLSRGEIWDAGKYKEKDSDIIEHTDDGRSRVRFVTVRAHETPKMMRELIQTWSESGLASFSHLSHSRRSISIFCASTLFAMVTDVSLGCFSCYSVIILVLKSDVTSAWKELLRKIRSVIMKPCNSARGAGMKENQIRGLS